MSTSSRNISNLKQLLLFEIIQSNAPHLIHISDPPHGSGDDRRKYYRTGVAKEMKELTRKSEIRFD